MKYLIITHKDCNDGFGAAWAAHTLLEQNGHQVDYLYMYPESKILNTGKIKGKRYDKVFFFDICPRVDELDMIMASGAVGGFPIEIHDHHKSNLSAFAAHYLKSNQPMPQYIHLDMNRSGAMMAWERLRQEVQGGEDPFSTYPVPNLIKYVQDRDLWKWELKDSKAFNAALLGEERTFKTWNTLYFLTESEGGFRSFVRDGELLLRSMYKNMDFILRHKYSSPAVDYLLGDETMIVNSSMYHSELGEELSQNMPIGLIWSVVEDDFLKIKVSLRSNSKRPNSPDVADIAKRLGGGGHKHAAGFKVGMQSDIGRALLGDGFKRKNAD